MNWTLFEEIDADAIFSPCGTYRYLLRREWDDGRCITWLMFNPSTADATHNDQTIRKCIAFSRRWGYGRLYVVNLFAFRSPNPSTLGRNTDPVGPENDYFLKLAFSESREIICAWGCEQHLTTELMRARPAKVLSMISNHTDTKCLGKRSDGAPRHPLMVSYSVDRQIYRRPRASLPVLY